MMVFATARKLLAKTFSTATARRALKVSAQRLSAVFFSAHTYSPQATTTHFTAKQKQRAMQCVQSSQKRSRLSMQSLRQPHPSLHGSSVKRRSEEHTSELQS